MTRERAEIIDDIRYECGRAGGAHTMSQCPCNPDRWTGRRGDKCIYCLAKELLEWKEAQDD